MSACLGPPRPFAARRRTARLSRPERPRRRVRLGTRWHASSRHRVPWRRGTVGGRVWGTVGRGGGGGRRRGASRARVGGRAARVAGARGAARAARARVVARRAVALHAGAGAARGGWRRCRRGGGTDRAAERRCGGRAAARAQRVGRRQGSWRDRGAPHVASWRRLAAPPPPPPRPRTNRTSLVPPPVLTRQVSKSPLLSVPLCGGLLSCVCSNHLALVWLLSANVHPLSLSSTLAK